MLTQERLKILFEYSKDSGNLIWRISRGSKSKGSIAGAVSGDGYLYAGVDGGIHLAHRLVWIYEFGGIPNWAQIDHINRIKTDNRICNLRLATGSQNQINRHIQRNNSSGVRGVSWMKRERKWKAVLCGKFLGYFDSLDDAERKYKQHAMILFGEFAD